MNISGQGSSFLLSDPIKTASDFWQDVAILI